MSTSAEHRCKLPTPVAVGRGNGWLCGECGTVWTVAVDGPLDYEHPTEVFDAPA